MRQENKRVLTKQEKLVIENRNRSDRLVDIALNPTMSDYHHEISLQIAGDYYSYDNNIKNDDNLSINGALLTRAKNMNDVVEKDTLSDLIDNRIQDATRGLIGLQRFALKTAKTLKTTQDKQVKDRCFRHLMATFKGRC